MKTREDLKVYLLADQKARFGDVSGKRLFLAKLKAGSMWSYNVILRKLEFNKECGNYLRTIYYKIRLRGLSVKTGWDVSEGVFGPELCIVHRGTVVVNPNAHVGNNCRIHIDVNIGADARTGKAPIIGDDVYIAPGAKIFGDIRIADGVAIGANAVVNKSFLTEMISIAAVPAKKISDTGNPHIKKGDL